MSPIAKSLFGVVFAVIVCVLMIFVIAIALAIENYFAAIAFSIIWLVNAFAARIQLQAFDSSLRAYRK
jgi:hypothetical protein